MNRLRRWVTPLVTGVFALVAVTGVLLFFHLASPLARELHEWLSWGLVIAAAVHLAINFRALGAALRSRAAKGIVAAFGVLTALTLVPLPGGAGGPPERRALEALLDAPLPTVAALAERSPAELRRALAEAGLQVPGEQATLREIAQASGAEAPDLLARVFR